MEREPGGSLFCLYMVSELEDKIRELLEQKFAEPGFSDCFVVEVKIGARKLEVFLDSDTSITFETCHRVSRHLEPYLDESLAMGADYILEVSSAGVGKPLLLPRQYAKNKGRELEVKLKNGEKLEGLLQEAGDVGIELVQNVVVKEGKKKKQQTIVHSIPYEDMQKAIVKIRF